MYIVLPFCPSFLLPQPKACSPAPGCSRLIKLRVPVSHVWLEVSSAVSSGQTHRRAAKCTFFSPSPRLFVSVLFQLSDDFTLLSGKKRLPSPNFFKLTLFFFI